MDRLHGEFQLDWTNDYYEVLCQSFEAAHLHPTCSDLGNPNCLDTPYSFISSFVLLTVFSGNIIEYFNFPVSSSKRSGIKQCFQEINCWLLKKVGIKHWSIKSVMIERKIGWWSIYINREFRWKIEDPKVSSISLSFCTYSLAFQGKNGYKKNQVQCRYILHLVNSFTLERNSNSTGIYTFPRIYHM